MTRQAPSVLPPPLRALLARLGAALDKGTVPAADLESVIAQLAALPPSVITAAARIIANEAGLYGEPQIRGWFRLTMRSAPSALDLLAAHPKLAYLFLFHHNGRAREAALQALAGALPGAFFVAALAWRLNDWAAQVRAAAVGCAARVFPATDPAIIARAAVALVDRRYRWQRWSGEAEILEAALCQPAVVDGLADILCTARSGPMSAVLRHALRWPAIDRHLATLSIAAIQPAVRAVALQTLLEGRGKWPIGWTRQWIDKTYNQSRMVTAYGEREIARLQSREVLIARAASDRSAIVRRAAAAALVDLHKELGNTEEIIRQLADDRCKSVRERVDFVRRARVS